jgi:hypothetical protein
VTIEERSGEWIEERDGAKRVGGRGILIRMGSGWEQDWRDEVVVRGKQGGKEMGYVCVTGTLLGLMMGTEDA